MSIFLKKLFYKKSGNTKKYKILGITFYKKTKTPTKKEYRILGIPVFSKEKKKHKEKLKIMGIKFSKKVPVKNIQNKDYIKYYQWIADIRNNKSLFIPMTKVPYTRNDKDIKIFAYYLSQFHCIPENDAAHGKGFTEWSNVAATVPAFANHYQPKIPYDLGFYNLLMPGVMERQVEIAKTYGIYGFCFYYYWFNGKKALEKPLEYFLNSKIDFHFHFFWANETWSSRWQGGNKEIILEQKYDIEKFEQFFYDILPYFKDNRYEKIDNKPILMIYHPEDMGKDMFVRFVDTINNLAVKHGFNGIYTTTVFDFEKDKHFLQDYHLNGLTEFFPAHLQKKLESHMADTISAEMKVNVYNLHKFIKEKGYIFDTDYDLYKCCCPNWDNSARKLYTEADLYSLEDGDFRDWLHGNIKWTQKNNTHNKQYTYVNAWNEWGEGAVLEPTTRYGYKDLQTVKDVLEMSRHD